MIIAKRFSIVTCATGIFAIVVSWVLSFINHFYTPPIAFLGALFLLCAIVSSLLKPRKIGEIYLTAGTMIFITTISFLPVWGGAGKTADFSEGRLVVQKASRGAFPFWELGFKW